MMNRKTLKDLEFKGKTVLVRCDFNVPMKNGKITDDNRIIQALPTIKYLRTKGAKVVLLSHLGRIKTEEDKKKRSLKPVATALGKLLNTTVAFPGDTKGKMVEDAIAAMKAKDVVLLENTRWEDLNGNAESKNSAKLGKYWASLGDVFVNDAYGTAHRSHASNVGIAKNSKQSCIGKLIESELKALNKVIVNPKRPLVAVVGGAKISDKIGVLKELVKKADIVLVGGGMASTFLMAQGFEVGNSLVDKPALPVAKEILAKHGNKIKLKVDSACVKEFGNAKPIYQFFTSHDPKLEALDIGPETIKYFDHFIKDAGTVIWNGPMGVFELSNYSKGTVGVCKSIAANKKAYTVIGGGDSAAAAINLGYADSFSHISTGGGASLEMLEGKKLPGIMCIKRKSTKKVTK